jgi:hypothetical protein
VVTRQKLSMPTDEPTLVAGERGAPPSWMTGFPTFASAQLDATERN